MRRQYSQFHKLRLVFLMTVMGLALLRCGSDEKKSATKFDQLYNSLFNQCGACHGIGFADTEGGPDLTSKDKVYENLVGKKGSDFPDWNQFKAIRQACANIPFINPGKANSSLVVAIFDNQIADSLDPCVVADHTSGVQLINISPATLALLKEWINEGAPR